MRLRLASYQPYVTYNGHYYTNSHSKDHWAFSINGEEGKKHTHYRADAKAQHTRKRVGSTGYFGVHI